MYLSIVYVLLALHEAIFFDANSFPKEANGANLFRMLCSMFVCVGDARHLGVFRLVSSRIAPVGLGDTLYTPAAAKNINT